MPPRPRAPAPRDGVPRLVGTPSTVPLTKREEGIKRVILNVMARTGSFPWDAHSQVFRDVGIKMGLLGEATADVTAAEQPDGDTLVADAQRPAEAAPAAPPPPVSEHALIDPGVFPNRQGLATAPTPMEIDAGAEVNEGAPVEPVVVNGASSEASGVPALGVGLPPTAELLQPLEAPVARNDGGSGPTGDISAFASAVVNNEPPPAAASAGLLNGDVPPTQPPSLLSRLPIDSAPAAAPDLTLQSGGGTSATSKPTPVVNPDGIVATAPALRAALEARDAVHNESRARTFMLEAMRHSRQHGASESGSSCTAERALQIVRAFRAAKSGIEQINAYVRYFFYTRYPTIGALRANERVDNPVGDEYFQTRVVSRLVGPSEDIQPGSRAWTLSCGRTHYADIPSDPLPGSKTYGEKRSAITIGNHFIAPTRLPTQTERLAISRNFPADPTADLIGYSFRTVSKAVAAQMRAALRPSPAVAAILHQISDLVVSQVETHDGFEFSALSSTGFLAAFTASFYGRINPLLQSVAIAAENSLGYNEQRETLAYNLIRSGVAGTVKGIANILGTLVNFAVNGASPAAAVASATRDLASLGESAIKSTNDQLGTLASQNELASVVYMYLEHLSLFSGLFMDEESFASHMMGFFHRGIQVFDSRSQPIRNITGTVTEEKLNDVLSLLWYTSGGESRYPNGDYHPFARYNNNFVNCYVCAPGWETAEERRGTIARVISADAQSARRLNTVRSGAGVYLADIFGYIEQKEGLRPPNDTRRPASLGASIEAINDAIAKISVGGEGPAVAGASSSSAPFPGSSGIAATPTGALASITSLAQQVNTTAISGDRTSIEGIEMALEREQKLTMELATREARTRPDQPELSDLGVTAVDAPSHPLNSIGGNRFFTGDDTTNPLVAYRQAIEENNDEAERQIYEAPSLARAPQSVLDGFFGGRFIRDQVISGDNFLRTARPPNLRFQTSDVREFTIPFLPASRSAVRVRALAPPQESHAYDFEVRPFDATPIAHFGVSQSPANDLVRFTMSATGVTSSLAASEDRL